MKAAFVTLCAVAFLTPSSSDAIQSPTHRQLILEGSIVPAKTKTYTVGLRHSVDGENVCGGSLIGPKHVLTASQCASYDIRWASIGSHYLNGTEDSEQIKVLSVMNNPNFSANVAYSDDFALLELESASAFKPVKLASSDDSDFKAGATATALGWGFTAEEGTMSEELRRVDLPLISEKSCAQVSTIDDSMLCAGGLISEDVCSGDTGGPLVVESSRGDVLIGVVSWRSDNACGRGPSYPGMYSRVSSARGWIDPIISSSCFD
ncbi:serine protease trypsin-like protein [Phytophthora sojae]|uniref:Serine protease trypsin-like protein n=1 Tax=Phytophthora sojae (strain P6497) TaxID=1094619 RepID=G5A4K9_PHYSP|nr:serine protease trypsin-like protein [Phytophthora sojae]EGZ09610.1 serine protease trypsin-like protein [Phytophthora sojae]|eukprot:XP_009534471.1 serine protease trypsin-like protein [Phytophthora sojae]